MNYTYSTVLLVPVTGTVELVSTTQGTPCTQFLSNLHFSCVKPVDFKPPTTITIDAARHATKIVWSMLRLAACLLILQFINDDMDEGKKTMKWYAKKSLVFSRANTNKLFVFCPKPKPQAFGINDNQISNGEN